MRQLETKTVIPKDHQHLVSKGKIQKDNRMLKDYGISVSEVIEMTGKQWEGTKHKSLSPTSMDTERDKKRKEKNLNHISIQADSKMKGRRQIPMKTRPQQRNGWRRQWNNWRKERTLYLKLSSHWRKSSWTWLTWTTIWTKLQMPSRRWTKTTTQEIENLKNLWKDLARDYKNGTERWTKSSKGWRKRLK